VCPPFHAQGINSGFKVRGAIESIMSVESEFSKVMNDFAAAMEL